MSFSVVREPAKSAEACFRVPLGFSYRVEHKITHAVMLSSKKCSKMVVGMKIVADWLVVLVYRRWLTKRGPH